MTKINSVDVYWASVSTVLPDIRYYEPVKALSLFEHKNSEMFKCPAFKDYYQNVYALKFPLDYNVRIEEDKTLHTDDYDAEFNSLMWMCRDVETMLYSLRIFNLFVSDQSLELEVTSAHTIDDSNFVNKTYMTPGVFDIGRWMRPIECAFFIKKNVDKLTIVEGKPYLFIRFKTDKRVKLKRFHYTKEMRDLVEMTANGRMLTLKIGRPLAYFYDMLARSRYKSRFMKLVKENLL